MMQLGRRNFGRGRGACEAHIRSDLQRASNAASGKKNQPELLRLFFRDAIVDVL
jgi:hypothetical protein